MGQEVIAGHASGRVELDDGWQLAMGRIAVDAVVEVVLNGVPANREELRRYGFSEEIIGCKRRWFMVRDEALSMLRGLLARRRAVRNAVASEASSAANWKQTGQA